jgi:hypothetical protein
MLHRPGDLTFITLKDFMDVFALLATQVNNFSPDQTAFNRKYKVKCEEFCHFFVTFLVKVVPSEYHDKVHFLKAFFVP